MLDEGCELTRSEACRLLRRRHLDHQAQVGELLQLGFASFGV